jgi:hypothetical protein
MDNNKEIVVVKIEDQIISAAQRDFSTGSKGYYGSGKVMINGKMHQVSMNIVEIGSRPKK